MRRPSRKRCSKLGAPTKPSTASGYRRVTAIDPLVLNNFPRTADGKLDLHRAPLQLLAIVNRFDLNLTEGSAGEGRFVFGVLGPGGFPLEFTFILEYILPASNEVEVQKWAEDWHALSNFTLGSEPYNAALQKLTERFAGRNSAPGRLNDNALLHVRTNEIALSFEWELRQFELSSATGHLVPTPLPLTPDLAFNQSSALGRYINENSAAIIAETHVVPESFEGAPFQAGAVLNDIDPWFAPDVVDNEARFHFSLNTCNGCHSSETNTAFLQIGPRSGGVPAPLSAFLTGTTVFDRVTGQPRALNELNRRNRILHVRVCPDTPPPPEPVPSPQFDGGGSTTATGSTAGGTTTGGATGTGGPALTSRRRWRGLGFERHGRCGRRRRFGQTVDASSRARVASSRVTCARLHELLLDVLSRLDVGCLRHSKSLVGGHGARLLRPPSMAP